MTTRIRPFASDNQITVEVADTALIKITIAPVIGPLALALTFNDNEAEALIAAIRSAVAASIDGTEATSVAQDFDSILR